MTKYKKGYNGYNRFATHLLFFVLGEHALQKLAATKDKAAGHLDVANLTNSLIVNPADIQGTSAKALAFVQKYGLKVERINLADNMPELNAYRKLTPEQISVFKLSCHF